VRQNRDIPRYLYHFIEPPHHSHVSFEWDIHIPIHFHDRLLYLLPCISVIDETISHFIQYTINELGARIHLVEEVALVHVEVHLALHG